MTGQLIDTAFRLRPNDEYLYANWLEYFHAATPPARASGIPHL